MTLLLERGTRPARLGIKTFGLGIDTIFLGDYEISLEDFLFAAHYVLTNTDLEGPEDPRLQFLKCIRSMEEVEGYMKGAKRLKTSEPPVPKRKRIRIVTTPPGEAPEEIRKQWVGAEIPILNKQSSECFPVGVLEGDPDSPDLDGYVVRTDEAIRALRGRDEAELWWSDWRQNHPVGTTSDVLIFAKDVCELIP